MVRKKSIGLDIPYKARIQDIVLLIDPKYYQTHESENQCAAVSPLTKVGREIDQHRCLTGTFTWILKSPAIISSSVDITIDSRNSANSVRNVLAVTRLGD